MHRASFLLIIWVVTRIWAMDPPAQFQTLQDNIGIYLQHLGLLFNVQDYYKLILVKDVSPCFKTVQEVENLIYKLFNIEKRHNNITRSYIQSLTLKTDLNSLRKELNEIDLLFQKPRIRRGWFNILGTGLHTLFGTMDANDDKQINSAIRVLQDSNKRILTLNEESTKILLSTVRDFNKTLNSMSMNENLLNQNFQEIQDVLNNEISKININELNIKILNLAMIISELINEIRYDINKINNYILYSHLSILPFEFLSEEKVIEKINGINSNNFGLKIPFSATKENLLKYQGLLTSKVKFQKQYFVSFTIQIPLVNNDRFNLYKLIPIPFKSNVDGHYNIVLPNYQFIALDQLNTTYIGLHWIDKFLQINTEFFSKSLETKTISNKNNCELDLIFQRNIAFSCRSLTIPFTEETIHPLNNNEWIIILTAPSSFTYKCEGQDIRRLDTPSTGILKLKPKCKGYLANDIHLSSSGNRTKTINLTSDFVPIGEDCCLESEHVAEQIRLPTVKLSSLNQDGLTLNKHRLERLQEEIVNEKLRPFVALGHQGWFISIISLGTTILVSCCLIYCCCPKCVKFFRPGCGDVCIKIMNINKPRTHVQRRPSYRDREQNTPTLYSTSTPALHIQEETEINEILEMEPLRTQTPKRDNPWNSTTLFRKFRTK